MFDLFGASRENVFDPAWLHRAAKNFILIRPAGGGGGKQPGCELLAGKQLLAGWAPPRGVVQGPAKEIPGPSDILSGRCTMFRLLPIQSTERQVHNTVQKNAFVRTAWSHMWV